jgi:hypothetical protein
LGSDPSFLFHTVLAVLLLRFGGTFPAIPAAGGRKDELIGKVDAVVHGMKHGHTSLPRGALLRLANEMNKGS